MTKQRIDCATEHAEAIQHLADELDVAIHLAARDGYHVALRLKDVKALGGGAFIGHGAKPARIYATIAFDIGKAVR